MPGKIRVPVLKIIAALVSILLLAWIFSAWYNRGTGPLSERLQPEETLSDLVFNGFYTNGRSPWTSYASLCNHRQYVDEISPLWYRVGGDGNLAEEVDYEALRLARENGIKVLPLAALSPGGRKALLDPATGKRAAENIARVVIEKNYEGINIDFELTREVGKDYSTEKEGLTRFMADMQDKLKPHDKRLDISVIPPEQPPSHLAGIYDFSALADLTDRMVLMAYDYSHPRSVPGPVAPLTWAEANIKAILAKGIKPEKLSLGVAAYGYDWPSGSTGGKARPAGEILQSAGELGIKVQWDNRWSSPYLKYTDSGGRSREAWFESSRTAEEKIRLAKKYRLIGISVWRLGYEDPGLWPIVEKQWGIHHLTF